MPGFTPLFALQDEALAVALALSEGGEVDGGPDGYVSDGDASSAGGMPPWLVLATLQSNTYIWSRGLCLAREAVLVALRSTASPLHTTPLHVFTRSLVGVHRRRVGETCERRKRRPVRPSRRVYRPNHAPLTSVPPYLLTSLPPCLLASLPSCLLTFLPSYLTCPSLPFRSRVSALRLHS